MSFIWTTDLFGVRGLNLLGSTTNHHQRISPFGSKNMAIGYPNISTSPCWSMSIPFFDADEHKIFCWVILFLPGDNSICHGSSTIYGDYPSISPFFVSSFPPQKKILQFRGKWPFFSICFRFWSRQIASPNSRCLRPSPCVDGHTSQDFVAAFNPGCLCYTVTLLYTHFTRSSLLPNMKNCQQHPHVRWLHGQSLIVLLLVMIIFIDFHLQDYMHFIMTSY